MSDSDNDSDDFNWDEPLPDQMKLTLAIIEKLTGNFSMAKWKEIAAASGMSPATAKQRFGRLRDKYLAEMPSLPENDNEANVGQATANDDDNEDAPGPSTSKRSARGKQRAAPRDEEEIEDDGEDGPSEPPVSTPAPLLDKEKQREVARDGEDVEVAQEDPTLTNPFAKPLKNADGRTPLPPPELIARRRAAKLAMQPDAEQ